MVGLNLLTVGAAAETHLGDTPAATTSPSEGTDFAGVLETILPAGEPPTPDEAATADAPDADPVLTPLMTLGLMTLPTTPTPAPTTGATHTTPTPEPSLRLEGAENAQRLQAFTPFPLEPTQMREPTPAFDRAAALGDGRGDADFAQTPDSENLLTVDGDAPPVPARQAAPPSPPSSTATQAAATSGNSTPDARADASPAESAVPFAQPPSANGEPTTLLGGSPMLSGGQPLLSREPRRPNDEQPFPLQDTRLPHGHAAAPTMSHAAPAVEDATRLQPAAPNWGAAEQIAHYIERMVYERERNRLSVRLDPPELGVVELRIRATGGEVQAWLTAERDLTRQMLQQAQQYLREQLESRGLHLTHFDVGAQSQFQHAPREQHTRYAAQTISTRTPTATDSLLHDGRWSVWV